MRPFLVMALLALFSGALYSSPATLFSDDFSSDPGNWNGLLSSTYTIANGEMTLQSTSSSGQAWAAKLGTEATDFTYSAKTIFLQTDTNARVGLTFRTQNNLAAYHFYVYPSGSYIVYRYKNSLWTDFSNHFLTQNSFIRSDTNVLAVTANGSTFEFFCNGQKLTSIVDSSTDAIAAGGLLGLIVTGKCSAAFDDVRASTSDPLYSFSSFTDSFSKPNLYGWRNYGGLGTFTVNSGKLQVTTPGTGQICELLSDGDYGTTDTIEVSAVPQTPLPTGAYNYGIAFHYRSQISGTGTNVISAYLFCIVNGSYFTLLKQGSGTVTTLFTPEGALSIRANGENVLKVIHHPNGLIEMFINGGKVKEFTENSLPSGGVGLMANGGVQLLFDNFKVTGTNPEIAVEKKPNRNKSKKPTISAYPNPFNPVTTLQISAINGAFTCQLIDVVGHTVWRGAGVGTSALTLDGSKLSSGCYILRLSSSEGSANSRLILMR